MEAGCCIISFLIYYHAPPPAEVIIMTTTIIIAEILVMTLLIVLFNMKDVCFCKYTPAVLKKELRQAKKFKTEPGFSGLKGLCGCK